MKCFQYFNDHPSERRTDLPVNKDLRLSKSGKGEDFGPRVASFGGSKLIQMFDKLDGKILRKVFCVDFLSSRGLIITAYMVFAIFSMGTILGSIFTHKKSA